MFEKGSVPLDEDEDWIVRRKSVLYDQRRERRPTAPMVERNDILVGRVESVGVEISLSVLSWPRSLTTPHRSLIHFRTTTMTLNCTPSSKKR